MVVAQVISFPAGARALDYLVAVDYWQSPRAGNLAVVEGPHQWTVRLTASTVEAAFNRGMAEFFDTQEALGRRGFEVLRVRTVALPGGRSPKEARR